MKNLYEGTHLEDKRMRDPAIVEALAALNKLPEDDRRRLCSIVIGKILASDHSDSLGKPTDRKGVRPLLFKGVKKWDEYLYMPREDHTQMLEKNGKLTLVSQPYDMSLSDIRKIVEKCDEYGLDAHVHGSSWYNPGATFVIQYTRRESDK